MSILGFRRVTVLLCNTNCIGCSSHGHCLGTSVRLEGGEKLKFLVRMAELRPGRQVVSLLTLSLAQSRFAKLYKKELSYEVLRTAVK